MHGLEENTNAIERLLRGAENLPLDGKSKLDSEFFQFINKLVELKRNEEELTKKLEEFQEVIANMANLDFEQKLPVEKQDNVFNYIAISVNMLNEELAAKTVSSAYLKGVMDTSSDAIIITDANGVIREANEALGKLVQGNLKQLIGLPIEKIIAEDDKGNKLYLAELPKEFPVDLLGVSGKKIKTTANVWFLEDKATKSNGYVVRFKSDVVISEELDEETISRSKLTKRQALTLMEAIEMMDFYSYWKYFVKEPENVRLSQKFELVEQFVRIRDLKAMAEINHVKDATLSSNLKQAMKFIRNESVRERYLRWVDENTPLTTFTKKDLQELKEETEYMITAKLIEKLNKRKNQLKYSRKAELMGKSLKEVTLDKGTLMALNQLGVYKIGDLRAWNIKSLAEQNHITRNHLESIKETLRQLGCLYILKESLEE